MAAKPETNKTISGHSADIRSSDWLGSVSASERKKLRDNERYKNLTPAQKQEMFAKQKERNRKNGMREWSPEIARECIKNANTKDVRDRVRATQLGKGESNEHARVWSLISPDGEVFKFRNLSKWVSDNQRFFTPEQMAPANKRGTPKIVFALHHLSPRRKKCVEQIFGWRWHIDGKHHDTLLSVLPNVQAQR